jgi:hypothetical protein
MKYSVDKMKAIYSSMSDDHLFSVLKEKDKIEASYLPLLLAEFKARNHAVAAEDLSAFIENPMIKDLDADKEENFDVFQALNEEKAYKEKLIMDINESIRLGMSEKTIKINMAKKYDLSEEELDPYFEKAEKSRSLPKFMLFLGIGLLILRIILMLF